MEPMHQFQENFQWRSQQNYWSLQDEFDLFILGLGANDMLRGISPKTTKTNLEEIIKSVQNKNISILLVGMQAPSSYGQDYQSSFNSIYPELAEEYEIFFLSSSSRGRSLKCRTEPNLMEKHPNSKGIAFNKQKK